MNKKSGPLSEIEAAIHLKTSPELLRYFTRRAVKKGETRKLAYTKKNDMRWFARAELDDYDEYLREPWPKDPGAQRPTLPPKIREDIMLEAMCSCPVCGHDASGEAAHIKPVSETNSHHPENLIWLCPNHHKMVDKVAEARNVTMTMVIGLKEMLIERRMMQLHAVRNASADFLDAIRRLQNLAALLDAVEFAEAKKGLEAIGKLDIAALEAVATKVVAGYQAGKDGYAEPLNELATSIKTTLKSSVKPSKHIKKNVITLVADKAGKARTHYLKETGQVDCPVCKGSGRHNGNDCAACGGEGAVPEERADHIDRDDYELVDCPVCEGSRRHKHNDCPRCGGEGEFERRYLAHADASDYDDVDCPTWEGSGRRNGSDCGDCGGEGTMEKRFADQLDPADHDLVPCPACAERGEDRNCPVCDGNYEIERGDAAMVEPSDYRFRACKLCDGSGQFEKEDCPPCGGNGEMEGRFYDDTDWRGWDRVDCRACDGKGHTKHDDCRRCGGEGTLFRNQL